MEHRFFFIKKCLIGTLQNPLVDHLSEKRDLHQDGKHFVIVTRAVFLRKNSVFGRKHACQVPAASHRAAIFRHCGNSHLFLHKIPSPTERHVCLAAERVPLQNR